jgi:hypothetical protein
MIILHAAYRGQTLCGNAPLPGQMAIGYDPQEMSSFNSDEITCEACRKIYYDGTEQRSMDGR